MLDRQKAGDESPRYAKEGMHLGDLLYGRTSEKVAVNFVKLHQKIEEEEPEV